jgi:hypothetical protein
MAIAIAIVAAIAAVVLMLAVWLPGRRGNSNEPPWMPYWIPWVGSAVEFGRAPLLYIDCARKKENSILSLQFCFCM